MARGQRNQFVILLCIGSLFLHDGSRSALRAEPVTFEAVVARSFVITDPEVLEEFAFERVLSALTSDVDSWRAVLTRNETDLSRSGNVVSPLAGFIPTVDQRWRWPRVIGNWSHIRPIALVNRFDLAPSDYSHCGEYRLIFSRWTDGAPKLHIAVETIIPNPDRSNGRAGCARIAKFWADLTTIDSSAERRERLGRLFFRGINGYSPVLDRHNFERNGRIRTSEVGVGRPIFRQFATQRSCARSQPCLPRLARVPLDNMPAAVLFDASLSNQSGKSFRREFLRQVALLARADVNRYSMNLGSAYSTSDIGTVVPQFNYQLPFRASLRTPAGRQFRRQIVRELKRIGSSLTPEDIIGRAETQNCVGCHGKPGPVGGGLIFPKAFETGEHVMDDTLVGKSRLSPAMENVFVPFRVLVLEEYLHATTSQFNEGEQ